MKKIYSYLSFSLLSLLFLLAIKDDTCAQTDPYSTFAEEMPQPTSGYEAIYKKIVYPELAKKAGIQGKVYLLVYINESGSVDDVKVVKGIGGGCDEVAIKAVKSAKFTPGKIKGAAAKVKITVPVVFKL